MSTASEAAIERAKEEWVAATRRLTELRRGRPPEEFEDFALTGGEGEPVRLSELFGDRRDLVLVHNMGSQCPYCTMWADGFQGLLPHLESRAAFVVVSPDPPAQQRAFAASRGWTFRMVSAAGSDFTRRAGYELEDGRVLPGVSLFRKNEEGRILRVARDEFGPGDLYNGAWHLFALLEGGAGDWRPRFSYA